jgi:acetyl-CoA C-acetyltransferase
MHTHSVYLISSARTAIGSFQGALHTIPAPRLGAAVITEAIRRAKLQPDDVDEVFMGCVLTAACGQGPARQAALLGGLPQKVLCTTVEKVCGSGLQAIIMGARTLLMGDIDVAVCGGMENMTLAPYVLTGARGGYRMGNATLVDTMIHDGLWDPYNGSHMGMAAELCAREYGFTRQRQDDYAVESYRRALSAQREGLLRSEIVPLSVEESRGGRRVFDEDEEPGKFVEEKLRRLKPTFDPDGTVTAGNASSISDGGAAVVIASARAVRRLGLEPVARIVTWSGAAHEPRRWTTAPVPAMKRVLDQAQLHRSDIDFWEINEAFAVVALCALEQMGLPHSVVNLYGGACAIGHPIGATGARLVVTLLNVLQRNNARRGCVSVCIGGGEALAMIVERV